MILPNGTSSFPRGTVYSTLHNTSKGQESTSTPIPVDCQHLINPGAAGQILSAMKKEGKDKTSIYALNAPVHYDCTLGAFKLEATRLGCL